MKFWFRVKDFEGDPKGGGPKSFTVNSQSKWKFVLNLNQIFTLTVNLHTKGGGPKFFSANSQSKWNVGLDLKMTP